ncbi:MAG: hypothetical protein ACI9CF_001920 [Candidatus Omnitrophota bacterium]|jgi:uncharacterized protein YuzE
MSKVQIEKFWREVGLTGIQYDPEAAALYLNTHNKNKIKKTIQHTTKINIDVDSKSDIVGVEILDISPKQVNLNSIHETLLLIKLQLLQRT